jgi:hypothetical protein
MFMIAIDEVVVNIDAITATKSITPICGGCTGF